MGRISEFPRSVALCCAKNNAGAQLEHAGGYFGGMLQVGCGGGAAALYLHGVNTAILNEQKIHLCRALSIAEEIELRADAIVAETAHQLAVHIGFENRPGKGTIHQRDRVIPPR